MKTVNLGESGSILNTFVAQMRDVNVQNDRMRFRRNIERIGEIMAYEISRELPCQSQRVTTPLGVATMQLPDAPVVVATIMRAGLPFHHGFLNYLDGAGNAFVSAYRKYKDRLNFDVHIEYIASPALEGKILILTDPMFATGSSMELAFKALLTKGEPAHLHLASIIASRQAVDYIRQNLPQKSTTIWTAAIDESLDSHSYIVPGLGDVGDLAYGEKE